MYISRVSQLSKPTRFAAFLLYATLATVALPAFANKLVHDAEYYVLEAQHGEKWAKQNQSLEAKLKELRKKHGKPPNLNYSSQA